MKKTVLEIKEQDLTKLAHKPLQESPKMLPPANNFRRVEKKNNIKTYNDFVRMVINEEKKDLEEPHHNITPIKEKIIISEKGQSLLKKTPSKILTTANEKHRTEENFGISRKVFTPKANKITNENLVLKNIKGNIPNFGKKEGFNLTPNITPIKEVLPDKKVLVRSFSKGNLISNQNSSNNKILIIKPEKTNGQANSLAKKKSFESGSVYNVIQNSLPPKSKKTHENEVVESTTSAKNWNLTEDEKTLYGDRIIENYEKLELLGKGGFALVWLGADKLYNDRHVAIKQISKVNSENCKKELYFGQMFFDEKGKAREEFSKYPGINYITGFLHHKITAKDMWMVFELGGHTLSKLLYEMKGEFFKGERVYQIKYSKLFAKLHCDTILLQKFIRSISEALILLADYKIVHSDLKPDNILMELNKNNEDFEKVKLIDFGSAYSFDEAGNISMATPEYMPPEVLELILNANKYTGPHKSQIEALSEVSQPWSVDVWSLASIVLEILIGIPHWISYKCKVVGKKGKDVLKTGLFAVKGRTYDKIIAKQKNLIENLEEKLEECLDVNDPMNQKLCDLLIKMFEWNPKKRISPEEIVKHPFLNKNI